MQPANDNEQLPRTRAEAKAIGSTYYFDGKKCKYGHVSKRLTSNGGCSECKRDRAIEWNAENADKVKEYNRRWYADNTDKAKERSRLHRISDPKRAREYQIQWSAANRDKVRESKRRSEKKRLATAKGKLEKSVKAAIYKAITKGSKNGRHTFDLLGYSSDELKNHLESQFLPGMSWDNYGDWHIDHKIPKSVFNYTTPDEIDFKRAWAMSNLQPLWGPDNLAKGAKLTTSFQPSLALAA